MKAGNHMHKRLRLRLRDLISKAILAHNSVAPAVVSRTEAELRFPKLIDTTMVQASLDRCK